MSISESQQSTTETDDVVELLQSQHREVEQLFAQLSGGGEARREPFQCLVQLLAAHETAEEEVVYPALRSTGAEGRRIAEERTAEEDMAKKALSELEKTDVTGDDFNARLETFRQMVLEHAANEEREVFPRLRQSLDPDKLRSMRTAVEAAEKMAPTHPHPHAPESAIGNMLTGPFVAIADRIRNAMRGVTKR